MAAEIMTLSLVASDPSFVVEFCAAIATIIYIVKLVVGGEIDYGKGFRLVARSVGERVSDPLLDLLPRTAVGVGQLISEPKRSLTGQLMRQRR